MAASLRRADLSHSDLLLAFMREYYAFDHLEFNEPRARAALEQLLADDTLGHVWMILDGQDPVGYIVLAFGFSLEFQGRDAFVDEFYIRAAHRGHGLGTEALRSVADTCVGLDIRALHLEVERANQDAQALYRKFGFADHDRYLMTLRIADRRPT